MYSWFKERLPIKRKLRLSFHTQLLFMVGIIAVPLLVEGRLPADIEILPIQAALVVTAGLLAFVMRGVMGDPYVATVVRLEALVAGDLASPIPFTHYSDCVGRLSKAMLSFRDAALAKIASDERDDTTRATSESERTAADDERAAAAEQQQTVVDCLAQGLSRLSEGDLTFQITQSFAADYDRLRIDFNHAVEQLRTTMAAVIVNTAAIRSGTSEIAQASDDLSRRTEQQAASLEQTASALDQITATVRQTAEGSAQARTVVSTAKQDAEHSGKVVNDAVTAMGAIEDSSRQIGQIIGVIDEIAFQTNLLALNAGVEAARAGDAGRGFAVVASEVRALAQRSAQAAKEIKTLIHTSDGQVKTGVGLVSEAGKALTRIVQQIAEINKAVTVISASAQEQASGLAEVNSAVNQMDQVTQQNAAMTEQSTAAAHNLAQETDELGRLIARFKVGEQPLEAPLPRAKPARKAEPRRPALKVVGARAAPAMVAANTGTDSWREF